MSRESIQLTPPLHDYLLGNSLREPEILRRLREETARLPQAGMQISPEQGQLIRLLLELVGAKRTIEIGVFTGYSTLSAALALPPDGQIVACDVSEEYTSVARRWWKEAGIAQKITLRLAPAVETLTSLIHDGQTGRFDFAFIDADKENYGAYYDLCMQLVRSGGLIAVDNVLWSGRVADPNVTDPDTDAIRALNRRIHEDRRVSVSLLPIGDGMTLARKL